MKIKLFLTTAAVVTFFALPGLAAVWQVDKDHTEIRFEVNHILTPVSGRFKDFDGDIVFDPKNPENARINFTVAVDSVDTGIGKRDNHLRSKDFFHADEFPEMTFVSTQVSRVDTHVYALSGTLTIKGVSRGITTQFEYFPPKPHPFAKGKQVAGFVTHFLVKRLEYQVGDGKFLKMGVVGEDVKVTLTMEALTSE